MFDAINMKLLIIGIATLLIISGAKSVLSDDCRTSENSLREVEDEAIEEEVRRRMLGGPWTPEESISIMNAAIDLLTAPVDEQKRPRRFQTEARHLIRLLTDEEDTFVETSANRTDNTAADIDYTDEPLEMGGHTPSDETLRKILDMVDGVNGQRRRSATSITTLYPWFNPSTIGRIRRRFEVRGTRADKFRALDREVIGMFKAAREKHQPIHGRMIQRWARQVGARIGLDLDQFKASDGWLLLFKRRHKIVSRKVTAYVSRPEKENEQSIAQRIVEFGPRYMTESLSFEKRYIWNFDQTGFNYEPANLRTLSFKGERDTIIMIDNRNKHTHSYTVQPMISRNGKLFPKLLIVTQEPGDRFGPIVGPRIEELESLYRNVEVFPSKSGKLSSSLINQWFNGTLARAVQLARRDLHIDDPDKPAVLVLADAWSGHSKQSQETDLLHMGAKLLRIPPSTTDKLQPLDVNFNRQLKIFYNRIVEEAFYRDILANVTSREGIINIHSLLHNQMCSSQYYDMIKYAWRNTDPSFNTSELTNHPPKMVNSIQFDFDQAQMCQVSGCDQHAFVKCSHCGRHLCLHHFLERICFHG